MKYISAYFGELAARFGAGWTRFWFTPSDPSRLSLVRLLTGLLAIYLHATLSLDLVRFFGAGGLLPSGEIAPLEGDTLSYLNLLSSPAELWAVHLIGLAVLVVFTAGLWTPVSTILATLVFLADVNRAVMLTGRTEVIVAMLLCYLCLAPTGARFSLQSLRNKKRRGASSDKSALSTAATIATRLIQVHLTLIIAMMGFAMLSSETWWIGSAMWWLIARQDSRLVDFTWLHQAPKVIDLWNHAVVLFSLAFPILVWAPLARPLLLGLGVLVWTSLALVTGDLTFALAMLIASLAFVPPRAFRLGSGGPAVATAARRDQNANVLA